MAYDFPASPSAGQLYNGYTWSVAANAWVGGQMAGTDAPADGAEYVRINNVWRKKSQSYDLTGLASVDIPVPAAAKMAKLAISAKMGATGALGLRWSTDGTTFPTGASDYSTGGSFHYSGSGGYATQPVVGVNSWPLTGSGDNLSIWHTVDLTMTVRRGAGGVFTGKWSGSSLNNSAVQAMIHFFWSGYSNYAWPTDQIKTLRVFTVAAMAAGAIEAEWVY